MATAILAMSSPMARPRKAAYVIASIPPPCVSFLLMSSRARLRRLPQAFRYSGEGVVNRSRPAAGFCEEVADVSCDQVAVLFEREVTGVEQVELQVLQITFVGFGPLRRKNEIVFSPHNKRRRLALTEVSLPPRVERRVRAVVVEELQLNIFVAGAVEQILVGRPRV